MILFCYLDIPHYIYILLFLNAEVYSATPGAVISHLLLTNQASVEQINDWEGARLIIYEGFSISLELTSIMN